MVSSCLLPFFGNLEFRNFLQKSFTTSTTVSAKYSRSTVPIKISDILLIEVFLLRLAGAGVERRAEDVAEHAVLLAPKLRVPGGVRHGAHP